MEKNIYLCTKFTKKNIICKLWKIIIDWNIFLIKGNYHISVWYKNIESIKKSLLLWKLNYLIRKYILNVFKWKNKNWDIELEI